MLHQGLFRTTFPLTTIGYAYSDCYPFYNGLAVTTTVSPQSSKIRPVIIPSFLGIDWEYYFKFLSLNGCQSIAEYKPTNNYITEIVVPDHVAKVNLECLKISFEPEQMEVPGLQ